MIPRTGALRKYRGRTRRERGLLMRTALLFTCAHVLVRVRDLRGARSTLARIARFTRARAEGPAQLAWAVAAVNTHLPGKHSCLINAVCCEAIAAASSIEAEFKIGAARDAGRVHFHAWVEHAGQELTGAHHGEFIPMA